MLALVSRSTWAARRDTAREAALYVAMAARLARDVPPFLQRRLSLDAARSHIARGLAEREVRFLDLVDRAVYQHPRSPYRQLLAHAGCEHGDLRALVRTEGIEGALRRLASQGVYVTFDEFKGRQVAVRGSARFAFSDRDFDSPLIRVPHYFDFTGGTSGRPMPVARTLDVLEDVAAMLAVVFEAHGIDRPRHVLWRGGSPSYPLVHSRLGSRVELWLNPVRGLPVLARSGLMYLRGLARVAGHRIPMPRYGDLMNPEWVARWLLHHPRHDGTVVVTCTITSAVRVAAAAIATGVPLTGVTFYVGGEPLTARRRGAIEASGAGLLLDYSTNELPSASSGCVNGVAPDDVHLMTNLYAVIQRQRELFTGGVSVDALLFTTLSPTAGKIGINVEPGDSARIEIRDGDCCRIGGLGLTTHLSDIRSFEKMSSEGTTFVRSNLIQILEEELPARFGGDPVDYQLVEEEGSDGATRLVLHIDPRVGRIDHGAVRALLLSELRRGGLFSAFQAALIERADSIIVRRRAPLATRGGKVLPFHLQRNDEKSGVGAMPDQGDRNWS
ncbi:MAG: hypothetical protein U0821_07410 [Chloroflexota bacterium]